MHFRRRLPVVYGSLNTTGTLSFFYLQAAIMFPQTVMWVQDLHSERKYVVDLKYKRVYVVFLFPVI